VVAKASEAQATAALNTAYAAWVGLVVALITTIVAGLAARFAYLASKAARDTVNVLSEVEQASIAVTLDAFDVFNDGPYDPATSKITGPKMLRFNVLAHNLGRSTAVIVQAAAGWTETQSLEENRALLGPPKSYIVKPAESAMLDLHVITETSQLEESNFLWVLVSFNAPLRGLRLVRYCFEVWGVNSNVPYVERQRDEWDPNDKGRKFTPTGTIQSFVMTPVR
jgi:hypothetical protein